MPNSPPLMLFMHTHTHTTITWPFSMTTRLSQCQKKSSSGLYGAMEDNRGRHTDTPSALIGNPPPSSLHFYARCPSCRNSPNLSWLGTCTKYACLHTKWLGSCYLWTWLCKHLTVNMPKFLHRIYYVNASEGLQRLLHDSSRVLIVHLWE